MKLLYSFLGSLVLLVQGCASVDAHKQETAAAADVFNVRNFGAKPDGNSLSTDAIQAAINACAEAGGGTVHFPPGTYLSGSLFISQGMELYLSAGATLLASGNLDHYQEMPKPESKEAGDSASDSRGRKFHFLIVEHADAFSIAGKGTIDGNGKHYWGDNWEPVERPSPFMLFKNCSRLSISDVHIQNSPSHTIQLNSCNGVLIDGISINNPQKSANTDGIDINDSRNVRISNCHLHSGDDLICLKSQRDTVENVVVTNCILESDDAAIKFGTGSRAAIRFCSFDNLVIRSSRYGIAMFMLDGGVFEHNRFSNITIESGGRSMHHYPIFVDVDRRVANSKIGTIRHNTFENIHIVSGGKVLIGGHEESPIEHLSFRNVEFIPRDEADFSNSSKPRGNKNYPKTEHSIDLSRENAHIIMGYVGSGSVDQVRVDDSAKSKRKPILFYKSEALSVN